MMIIDRETKINNVVDTIRHYHDDNCKYFK